MLPPVKGNGNQKDNAEPIVKAIKCSRVSYIRFLNTTQRKVDVIWINYQGIRVQYKKLEPGEFFDVTSFVSHPWIFRDAETHTKLICGLKEVFDCPEPVYVKVKDGDPKPTRVVVAITLPLFSLLQCAQQAIQKLIKDPKDVYSLEIPFQLKNELYDICYMKPRPTPPLGF